jgi:8-oxo-dGTP diphosphatase
VPEPIPPKINLPDIRFAVLAVDVVVFSLREGVLVTRLMTVNRPPNYVNRPGFPGGIIRPKETSLEAAERILEERGGIAVKKVHLEQLYTFSRVDRDPRGRVVSVAYLALVPWEDISGEESKSNDKMQWQEVSKAKNLAYDHDEVLDVALERLRSKIEYTTMIGHMLPNDFTLTELESAYKVILKKELDKRNFRKKILSLDILESADKKRAGGRFRPAELYRFKSRKVQEINIL